MEASKFNKDINYNIAFFIMKKLKLNSIDEAIDRVICIENNAGNNFNGEPTCIISIKVKGNQRFPEYLYIM